MVVTYHLSQRGCPEDPREDQRLRCEPGRRHCHSARSRFRQILYDLLEKLESKSGEDNRQLKLTLAIPKDLQKSWGSSSREGSQSSHTRCARLAQTPK